MYKCCYEILYIVQIPHVYYTLILNLKPYMEPEALYGSQLRGTALNFVLKQQQQKNKNEFLFQICAAEIGVRLIPSNMPVHLLYDQIR